MKFPQEVLKSFDMFLGIWKTTSMLRIMYMSRAVGVLRKELRQALADFEALHKQELTAKAEL